MAGFWKVHDVETCCHRRQRRPTEEQSMKFSTEGGNVSIIEVKSNLHVKYLLWFLKKKTHTRDETLKFRTLKFVRVNRRQGSVVEGKARLKTRIAAGTTRSDARHGRQGLKSRSPSELVNFVERPPYQLLQEIKSKIIFRFLSETHWLQL